MGEENGATLRAGRLRLPLLVGWALLVANISGCGSAPSRNLATPSATRVPIPAGFYAGVAWFPGGWIVLEYSSEAGSELWKVRPDGSKFERIPLAADAACRRTQYSNPAALPNGNLGLVRWCFGPGIHLFLESYSWDAGKQMPLILHELPFNPHQFTVDPGTGSGYISTLSDICGTIAAFNSTRVQPLPIRITDRGHSWRLDDHFHTDPARRCTNEGRADWPTLSADSSRLAFVASGPEPGVRDFARLDLPWSVFITDPTDLAPRPVLAE